MCEKYEGFVCHQLSEGCAFYTGRLPGDLIPDLMTFESIWILHPDFYHKIHMPSGPVLTPRFQQAYGVDYQYSGMVNKALPVPSLIAPHLKWCQRAIDPQLNGLLLNWYDGKLGHYIGKHRDSTKNIVHGAPIVTISFGEERIFRLRPWRAAGYQDFEATNGSVFVMPYETNLKWTHEVPHWARFQWRRVSITARAFNEM